MGSDVPKQYLPLADGTVLEQTLTALSGSGLLSGIVLVHAEGDPWLDRLSLDLDVPLHREIGGTRRADSVLAGLRALHQKAGGEAWVMVHDAARPCVSVDALQRLHRSVLETGRGAILATPVTDSLKQAGDGNLLARSVDRSTLWRAQTPQLFHCATLLRALEGALAAGEDITDEASAMEWAGEPVGLVEGESANIKITLPGDLAIAEALLGQQTAGAADHVSIADAGASSMRVGHGYDVHRFGPGDHVVLGGVRIAHGAALEAHSDGDVLIHALCDALLGALGAGDIGRHFPDTDPANADIDSRILLRRVHALLSEQGWRLANADMTLVAQAPKMAPHIDAMRSNLAADLKTVSAAINVKATTTEKLGFAGREEGIAAHAVVCLERIPG
jgi:2-C-methyl-D-erythritol 2,4-cyclodiphosphate synthase/2-C-methyl-D-erythritol 4-phosphate cytidylyltransferase